MSTLISYSQGVFRQRAFDVVRLDQISDLLSDCCQTRAPVTTETHTEH